MYRPAGDEHGIIESSGGPLDLEPGDQIELIPSHIDTTVALHDKYHLVRSGRFEAIVPIEARGKVQ